MRKLSIITIAVFIFSGIVNGQIKKGSISIGGELGFNLGENSSNNSEGNTKSFYFSPAIGKAIKENLIAGFSAAYSRGKSKNYYSNPDSKSKGFGGGFFLRKYKPLGKNFFLFGETGIEGRFANGKNFRSTGEELSSYTEWGARLYLYPGLSYAATRKLFLELMFPQLAYINYSRSKQTYFNSAGIHTTTKSSALYFASDLQSFLNFAMGFRFIIPNKKETAN